MQFVKQLIKEGVDKQSIFDKAEKQGLKMNKVAKILASYPDPQEAQQYHMMNMVLSIAYTLLVLSILLKAMPLLLSLPPSTMLLTLGVVLFILGYVIYLLVKKRAIAYLVLCFFLFKGILDSIASYTLDPTGVLIGLAVNIVLLIYIVSLKNKLFPYQNFLHLKRTADGLVVFTKTNN